jgi:hypothetical protein
MNAVQFREFIGTILETPAVELEATMPRIASELFAPRLVGKPTALSRRFRSRQLKTTAAVVMAIGSVVALAAAAIAVAAAK